MIVAIYACEGQYGGLHGMNSHRVVEVENIETAREYAEEDSRQVMESYGDIYEGFSSEALDEGLEEGTEEFDAYIEECVNMNIEYQIWEVVDPYDTIQQMEKDFYNSQDEFVENHCRELE